MNNPEVIADFLESTIKKQSWYRKNANVINGVIASTAATLVFIFTYIQTTGDIPVAETAFGLIVPVITGLSLRLTKNGIGTKQAEDLKKDAVVEKKKAPKSASENGFPEFKVDRG